MDRVDSDIRSSIMSKIRSKNTKPEMIARSYLYKKGYRYRLNVKNLPGKPDIVIRKYNSVIFVNGCFWHQHKNCKTSNMPKSNTDYWKPKLEGNVKRDKKNIKELKSMDFNVFVIWECQLKNTEQLDVIIKKIDKYKKEANK